MRALSREPQTILDCLRRDGELMVTNNGRPSMYVINMEGQDVFEEVNWIRQIRKERKESISRSQQQLAAFDEFIAAIRAIDDEPLTDEDFADLERNRVHFRREIDL